MLRNGNLCSNEVEQKTSPRGGDICLVNLSLELRVRYLWPNTTSLPPSQNHSGNMERQNMLAARSENNLGEMDDCEDDMKIKKFVILCSKVVTAISAPFFCKFVHKPPCIELQVTIPS